MDFLAEWEAKLGVKITCSQEDTPMGTAGPLGLARNILNDGSGDPFFVLNSDVICEFPLADMLAFHREKGAEGTILVTRVSDPSKYGVVVVDADERVERFVEKPQTFVGDRINAGIYCLSPSVLDRIEDRPTSIEKETFPAICADNALFAFTLPGYWMDVGQPRDYLTGLGLHLGSLRRKGGADLASGPGIEGNVLIDPSVVVGAGCKIGPNVAIGKDCVIGDGVRIRDSVLLHRVKVRDHARIADAIVGWESSVGAWARVENKAVIGEDCHVADEVMLNGTIVLPHKELKVSQMEPGAIVR
jgi:mannose-1-phosphate guanylyltransferase